jgi:hypothetical protein
VIAMVSRGSSSTERSWGRLVSVAGYVPIAIVGLFAAWALAFAGAAVAAPVGPASLAASIQNAEQVSSGRFNVTISAAKNGQSVALIVDRFAFDQPHHLRAVTLDYSRLLTLDPSLAPGIKPADLVVHVVFDGRHHTLYMGSPLFLTSKVQSKLPVKARHREWMKFSPRALRNAPGLSNGLRQRLLGILMTAPTSPLLALQALSPSPSATADGGLVDGVPTTQFSTTADMTKAVALGGDVSGLARAAGTQWTASVWIDSNSLIHKVQFVSPPVPKAGDASFVVTCRPQALGAPVTIKDPPPSKVIPIKALQH